MFSSPPVAQIALMGLETVFVAVVIVGLFRLRSILGLSPLYITLGVFQHMQVLLATSIYVELAPAIWVSPGSAVLFTGGVFAVLLVYLFEDALETRKLIYGLLLANLALAIFSFIASLHIGSPAVKNLLDLPAEMFLSNPRVLGVGTFVLLLDSLLLIILYEALSRTRLKVQFLRIYLTMSTVLVFDGVMFTLGAFLGQPDIGSMMATGVAAKLIAALVYSLILTFSLRFLGRSGEPQVAIRDLFGVLTYRQRYEALRREASRDPLTGLFHRGFFDTALRRETFDSGPGRPLSLLLIDIDEFKVINDNLGHPTGDRVLQRVAHVVVGELRSSDIVCRYGGDELAVLLPGAPKHQAVVLAERIRRAVAIAGRGLLSGPHRLTTTTGIASYGEDANVPAELVAIADRRLYSGKRRGRNQTVYTDAAPTPSATPIPVHKPSA